MIKKEIVKRTLGLVETVLKFDYDAKEGMLILEQSDGVTTFSRGITLSKDNAIEVMAALEEFIKCEKRGSIFPPKRIRLRK